MLERLRRRRNEKGFTLIELLVVVIIIGLLAAIAIPAFLGQRNKANDAAAKSLVRNAATAMEAYFSDGNTYATATPALLQKIEPNIAWSTTASDAGADQVGVAQRVDAQRVMVDRGDPAAVGVAQRRQHAGGKGLKCRVGADEGAVHEPQAPPGRQPLPLGVLQARHVGAGVVRRGERPDPGDP